MQTGYGLTGQTNGLNVGWESRRGVDDEFHGLGPAQSVDAVNLPGEVER